MGKNQSGLFNVVPRIHYSLVNPKNANKLGGTTYVLLKMEICVIIYS